MGGDACTDKWLAGYRKGWADCAMCSTSRPREIDDAELVASSLWLTGYRDGWLSRASELRALHVAGTATARPRLALAPLRRASAPPGERSAPRRAACS